jgi:hypothetical protein
MSAISRPGISPRTLSRSNAASNTVKSHQTAKLQVSLIDPHWRVGCSRPRAAWRLATVRLAVWSADSCAVVLASVASGDPTEHEPRKITRFFRTQKMTLIDLYVEGIDAPESMTKVYGIRTIRVKGSTVTIPTDVYPKSDNNSRVCRRLQSGHLRLRRDLGQTHRGDRSRRRSPCRWDDTDGDGTDDSSGYIACQSDL